MLEILHALHIHTWQDVVLTIGSVILDLSLIPTLRSKHKPHALTSLLFVFVVFSMAVVYESEGWEFATATAAIGALEWTVVLLQTTIGQYGPGRPVTAPGFDSGPSNGAQDQSVMQSRSSAPDLGVAPYPLHEPKLIWVNANPRGPARMDRPASSDESSLNQSRPEKPEQ